MAKKDRQIFKNLKVLNVLSPNERRLLFKERKMMAIRLRLSADPNKAIREIDYLREGVLRERDFRRAD